MISYDRDAGLSIKAWLDVNDNNHDAVAEVLNAYVGWVQKVGQIILMNSNSNVKPMFSRFNRRKTQMESTSVWSQSSRFRTATLTQEAGVDLRLTVLLSVQWLSPSKIS